MQPIAQALILEDHAGVQYLRTAPGLWFTEVGSGDWRVWNEPRMRTATTSKRHSQRACCRGSPAAGPSTVMGDCIPCRGRATPRGSRR